MIDFSIKRCLDVSLGVKDVKYKPNHNNHNSNNINNNKPFYRMPTRDGPEFPDANVPIVYAKTFLGDKFYVRSAFETCSRLMN